MIRCSCHWLHGCVPTAASAIPSPPASSSSCARRSPTFAAALVGEGLEQSGRDLFPAPALDYGAAGGLLEDLAVLLGQLEQASELGGQIAGVAGLEARQPALSRRIFGLEALGDLREAGV